MIYYLNVTKNTIYNFIISNAFSFICLLSKGNLSYNEEILVSSNIDKVIKVHENPDFLHYFLDGFISYKKLESSINNQEPQIEITLLFNPNESVSKNCNE